MFTETPRQRRKVATTEEILGAAWSIVRSDGLAALSMRKLANSVGLTAGALYRYFPSKMDIYDALFVEGHRELQAFMGSAPRGEDPEASFRESGHRLMAFCAADWTRYALLFQRPIPGFTPSEGAMALARTSYQRLLDELAALEITGQAAVDLWAAVHMGLTSQQAANDPAGDRWIRLVDDAVDMFLAHQRAVQRRDAT